MSDSSHGDEARRALAYALNEFTEQGLAAIEAGDKQVGRRCAEEVHKLLFANLPTIVAALRADPVRAVEEMRERASAACETEAGACIGDIVEGDELGAKLAHAMASALFTAAKDIRALPIQPAAEGGAE